MSSDAVTAEEFDRIARLHCRRWEARSLDVVRALLVDQRRISEVAEAFGMKPQQANVLRTRFLDRMKSKGAVKLPAEQFMQSVNPAAQASVLDPFKDDIKQLVKRGYSEAQITEFLNVNDVQVSDTELTTFLGAMNENLGSGESKGRRR
ncbi:hypothetical protein [Aquabacterium sp. CECT 9606]|uniref:hypothetical protein n=1 Tax=Aquabacterium sp. CECT 9606 TaxID=2845822 RepID=UPI001E592694|nr:hypothetical protein [Aquabacterium sp. CECT 9606]CAH0356002.1 hypothetical protein AQB9606_04496 [Aquabacterium sp. CECT 9606]